jgi:predicted transcriptional regulator
MLIYNCKAFNINKSIMQDYLHRMYEKSLINLHKEHGEVTDKRGRER